MGDISVILRGEESLHSRDLLYSTVHGAGRVMGRMEAKGKWKRGECVRPGKVTQEMMDDATRGLILRGGDLDEAPQAYRSLKDVLDCQGGTITVEHALQPVVVCMAPRRTR
jgi:tRNA-splicing ligase RtcB